MCPIVPTFTCGFVRSYSAFAIPHVLPLAVAIPPIKLEPMSGIEPETSSLPRTRSADRATWAHARDLERETGFEPATPSLEGWRSTTELFPPTCGATRALLSPPSACGGLMALATMVGRGGFEPPKAYASRFTVCPLWPLGYLPESAGTHLATPRKSWRWREDLNPRPTAYKAVALPLSYASTDKISRYA